MMKFVFVLVLALVACQEIGAASIKIQGQRRGLEEAMQIITELTEKVEQIISDISFHIPQLIQQLSASIQEIKSKVNLSGVIDEVKETIEKLIATRGPKATNCPEKAWLQIQTIVQGTNTDASKCEQTAQMLIPKLQLKMQSLLADANNVISKMSNTVQTCINEHGSDVDEIVNCIKGSVGLIDGQIDDLDKETKQYVYEMQETIRDDLIHLENCLNKVKTDFLPKTDLVIADLKNCIGITQFRTITAQPSWSDLPSIIEYIKSMIGQVVDLIYSIKQTITDMPAMITKKMEAMISHFNFVALASQLKAEIADIIDSAGPTGDKCGQPADAQVDILIATAESGSKVCWNTSHSQLAQFDNMSDKVVAEGWNLTYYIKDKFFDCVQPNPVKFLKCLENEIDPITQKINSLQEEIRIAGIAAKTIAGHIISSLATCVNDIQIETINGGQIIIKDVEKCIHTSN